MRHLIPIAILSLAPAAHAQIWINEQFEGTNAAAWTFDAPIELIEPTGGYFYCCAYLHGSGLHVPAPFVRTGNASTVFTGNYRALGITYVGVALLVRQTDLPVTALRPAAVLRSFNGTPGDPSDDWGAYRLSSYPLAAPGQWQFFSFHIRSVQPTLPSNWTLIPLGPNAPANPDWNVLAQGVDRLMFCFGDPSAAYPTQNWDVGADYMVISSYPTCFPNCDDSTAAPCLNVLDFVCFLNRFAAGDTRANCDASTTIPVLTVQDFACFLMSFAAGCNEC